MSWFKPEVMFVFALFVVSTSVQADKYIQPEPEKTPTLNCELNKVNNEQKSDNQSTTDNKLPQANTKVDTERLIVPAQLAAELEKVVLIDIRHPDEFSRIHIPGSINIKPFAIKANARFKKEKVVLIDHGYRPITMQLYLNQLNENGFNKVWILDGGITAWIRQGGKVDGNQFQQTPKTVRSFDIIPQLSHDGWLVIALTNDSNNIDGGLPFDQISVDIYKQNINQIKQSINQSIDKKIDRTPDKNVNVLLVGDQNTELWQSQHIADQLGYPNVFIAEGDINSLIQAYDSQVRLITKAGDKSWRKKPCGAL